VRLDGLDCRIFEAFGQFDRFKGSAYIQEICKVLSGIAVATGRMVNYND